MASKLKVDEISESTTSAGLTLNHSVAMAAGKTLPAASLTGALPAISGASLTGIQGSVITTEGNVFANYNAITATLATVLASGKNHALFGTITVNNPYVWTVTGEPLAIL